MPSIQAKVLNRIARISIKSIQGSQSSFVKRFRLVTGASSLLAPVPKGLKHLKGQLGGVPGEWLIPVNPRGALLYIHGGAYVSGSPPMYRHFCGALANALGLRVFMVDYRLAPEHPFPAPYDDCVAAFDALVKDTPNGEPIVVGGDSAGGNLSLAVLQHAVKSKQAVAAGLLISPGLDMRCLSPSIQRNNESDSMLSVHIIHHAAHAYLNGHDATDPKASSLLGNMKGLPPILVSASESECLFDDAELLKQAVQAKGGTVQVLSRPGMPHIWPVMTLMLPEAKEDLKTIIEFLTPLTQ